MLGKTLLHHLDWIVAVLFTLMAVGIGIAYFDWSPYKVVVVRSGSLEPAIPTGSLSFYAETKNYSVGDVVAFPNPIGGDNILTIHRILKIEEQEAGKVVITRGDANDADDAPVPFDSIKGEVLFSIPFIGFVVGWVKMQPGLLAILFIPPSLLAYHELTMFRQRRALKQVSPTEKEPHAS